MLILGRGQTLASKPPLDCQRPLLHVSPLADEAYTVHS